MRWFARVRQGEEGDVCFCLVYLVVTATAITGCLSGIPSAANSTCVRNTQLSAQKHTASATARTQGEPFGSLQAPVDQLVSASDAGHLAEGSDMSVSVSPKERAGAPQQGGWVRIEVSRQVSGNPQTDNTELQTLRSSNPLPKNNP